jgi:hypothetical protein
MKSCYCAPNVVTPSVAATSAPDDVVIKRDQAAINAGFDFRR